MISEWEAIGIMLATIVLSIVAVLVYAWLTRERAWRRYFPDDRADRLERLTKPDPNAGPDP